MKVEAVRINLAAARVNAGLTQAEVADKMSVSKRTIVDWEKGKSEPRVTQAYDLARLYGISTDNIFLPTNLT